MGTLIGSLATGHLPHRIEVDLRHLYLRPLPYTSPTTTASSTRMSNRTTIGVLIGRPLEVPRGPLLAPRLLLREDVGGSARRGPHPGAGGHAPHVGLAIPLDAGDRREADTTLLAAQGNRAESCAFLPGTLFDRL